MSDAEPVVYLLTGLPCSGKSTYARALERTGVMRLCVDEVLHARHGRPGKDFPGHDQPSLEAPILEEIKARMMELVRAGCSVVLDHGLGLRTTRDDHKQLVAASGGRWKLIYFQVDHAELRERLKRRNADPAYGILTEATLDWMIDGSEPPDGEGEEQPDPELLNSPL